MKVLKTLALAATLTLAAGSAYAHDYQLGDLEIDHPWSRATPKGAPVGGGFVTIENDGATADRLVSVASTVSERVEIHEMAMVDGIMKMRPLDAGVVIPPDRKVEFKPGGFHVMFIGLKQPLVKDSRFKATLTFEKAGTIEVEFEVDAAAGSEADHSGHSGH